MPPGSVLAKPEVYPAFPAKPKVVIPPVANDNVWHPKWARRAPGALGGRLNFYIQAGQLLHDAWSQFATELRLGEFLQMIPYGQLKPWGWSTSCNVGMNCASPGGIGTITYPPNAPLGQGWTDQVKVCTTLCTIPTSIVTAASINSQPYLWSGNATREVGYGYYCLSGGANRYFRAKLVAKAPAGSPADRFYLATRLRPSPGLLPDVYPAIWGEPGFNPAYQPGTSPMPNILPMTQPVWQPNPLPAPLPYAVPRPGVIPGWDPSFQPQVTPAPASTPAPAPGLAPGVSVAPAPGGHVSVAVQFPPTRAVTPEPPHVQRPPRDNEKESKSRGGAAVGAALAYGAATETNDFIEAAWQAMGAAGGWQTKNPGQKTTPAEMVADLYHAIGDPHFNAGIFWAQLPVEVAKNEVVDRGIGTVGQLGTAASVANPTGRPVGYGFGGTLGGGPAVPGADAPPYVYPWQ